MFEDLFYKRHEKIIGNEINKFKKINDIPITPSIHINTLKSEPDLIKNIEKQYPFEIKKVPWNPLGYFVKGEKLGDTVEHQLGFYWVQEAASMIPPLVLKPKENETVLDLTASPGSKTSQLALQMKNTGIIIANDMKKRLPILGTNLEKRGIYNTIVTTFDAINYIGRFKEKFDKILVDPSCSSTGTIRKRPEVIKKWNINATQRMASQQEKILLNSFEYLKENGTLVYSTCSLEPEENELVVQKILSEKDCEIEKIDLPGLNSRNGLTKWNEQTLDLETKNCLRIYPQDNDCDGFFVCKIRRLK